MVKIKKKTTQRGINRINSSGRKITGEIIKTYEPREIPINNKIIQIGYPREYFWDLIETSDIKNPKIITLDSINRDIIIDKDDHSGDSDWIDLRGIENNQKGGAELLIINPNKDIGGNEKLFLYKEIFEIVRKIVVCEVEDPQQHSLALRIAQSSRGTIRMKRITTKQGTNSFAWITPSRKINFPSPLKYPSIAKILPKKMKIPPPVGVANDYYHIISKVEENRREWQPNLNISVVIPLYNRKIMLGRTLAMLCNQTYPLEKIEIVIADDGSSDNPIDTINKFDKKIEINYVRQKDLGYRLSEIRNMGIRAAKNDYIILLDCDMAPITSMVETYARHLEITTRAVYCGHRRYVDANHLEVNEIMKNPNLMLELEDIETENEKMKRDGHVLDWRLPMYQSTDNLRFEKYPFRAICGGNIGFHKSLFERVGKFDEDFKAWGKEDTEWGFRVWNRGEYIIPLFEACGLHQEPPGGRNETDRELGLKEVMPTFIDRVPVMYRKDEHGNEHSVPLVSIYIPAFNAAKSIVETIQSVLDQTFEDLEICIAVDGCIETLKVLEKEYFDNPRVRWKYQENQGIGGASNTAVQMCRGVYIGQLDSDDLLLPNAIDILVSEIEKDTRYGVVYGSFQKETPEGEFLEDGYDWLEYSREKLMFGCIVHHFRLFRARDWWRTDGFATDMTNAIDFDIYLKLSEVTEMKHIQEWTYVYRIHAESTSIKSSEKQIMNHFESIRRTLKRRGLSNQWNVINKDENNPRNAAFEEIKDWDQVKDNSSSFAKMENKLKIATPLLVRELARKEASRKPWTISEFPIEKVEQRLNLIVEKNNLSLDKEQIYFISKKYRNNLWLAMKEIKSKKNEE
jgi:chondroitin synthase